MPDADATSSPQDPHYQAPGWFTRNVFNRLVAGLTRAGISVLGSRVLEAKGRKTGEPRRVPVNLLTYDDSQYLVAPRGHTQWVANVRADQGRLDLLLGRRRKSYVATELADDDPRKVEVLRAYLKRWKAEVGVFFGGVGPDSTDDELRAIAPDHPAFSLSERS
jgi:deazaflavin-dependent oxidoreductase (nitroreductase family)